jgi:hypothetical protein
MRILAVGIEHALNVTVDMILLRFGPSSWMTIGAVMEGP